MTTFNERLQTLIDHYGMNKNSFSIAIGASNNTIIGRIINDPERKPSFELMTAILKKFPSVSTAWLIMGDGEMFINRPDFLPDPKDRLKKMTEILKTNPFEIAKLTGLSKNQVLSLINGDAVPVEAELFTIAKAFPQINQRWLMGNAGEMMAEGFNAKNLVNIYTDIPTGVKEEDLSNLPVAMTAYRSNLTQNAINRYYGLITPANDLSPIIERGDSVIFRITTPDETDPGDLIQVITPRKNYLRRVIINAESTLTLQDAKGIELIVNKSDITMIGIVVSATRGFV